MPPVAVVVQKPRKVSSLVARPVFFSADVLQRVAFAPGSPRVQIVSRWIEKKHRYRHTQVPEDHDGDTEMADDEGLRKEFSEYYDVLCEMVDEGIVTNLNDK